MLSACMVSRSIRDNDDNFNGGGCLNHSRDRTRTWHSSISVTDEVKFNEQKKNHLLQARPFYMHKEFEMLKVLMPEDVTLYGVSDLVTLVVHQNVL